MPTPSVRSQAVDCSDRQLLGGFESHLEAIREKLDRCLKGIMDNEDSLKALQQQHSVSVASVRPLDLAKPAEFPASPSLSYAPNLAPSRQYEPYACEASRRTSETSADFYICAKGGGSSDQVDANLRLSEVEGLRELMRMRRASRCSTNCSLDSLSRDLQKFDRIVATPTSMKQRNRRSRFSVELWRLLDEPGSSRKATWTNRSSLFLICVSVILTVLDSGVGPRLGFGFAIIQLLCDSIFSLELIARFYSCTSRIVFLSDPYTLFEIVASLPILIIRAKCSLQGPLEPDTWSYKLLVAFLPVLRLLMVLRRFEQFHLQLSAFRSAAEALPVMLCTLLILIMGFSGILFAVEERSNLPSFSDAIWMTTVTCFTVGYGDALPETQTGRCVVCVLMVFSALYLAIPFGIVGDAFSRVWEEREALLLVRRMSRRLRIANIGANDVAALFYRFDKDGKGQISPAEFMDIVHSMAVYLDEAQAVHLFKIIDSDGNGLISDEEFVKVLFPSDFDHIYSAIHEVFDLTKHVATSAINSPKKLVTRPSETNTLSTQSD